MSRNQQQNSMEIKTIFFFVLSFILINLIAAFPFLIVLIIIGFIKFDISINKILKAFWVTDYIKNKYGDNYEKIITQMKNNKQHQARIEKNRNKRNEIKKHYSTVVQKPQISYREEKLKQMQRDVENKKNKETSFYEKNQKTLQEKIAHSAKQKKTVADTQKHSWRDSVSSQWKNTSKNYFWNSKTQTFWNGKSIWDSYESVSEKFSSNNK